MEHDWDHRSPDTGASGLSVRLKVPTSEAASPLISVTETLYYTKQGDNSFANAISDTCKLQNVILVDLQL